MMKTGISSPPVPVEGEGASCRSGEGRPGTENERYASSEGTLMRLAIVEILEDERCSSGRALDRSDRRPGATFR